MADPQVVGTRVFPLGVCTGTINPSKVIYITKTTLFVSLLRDDRVVSLKGFILIGPKSLMIGFDASDIANVERHAFLTCLTNRRCPEIGVESPRGIIF